MKVTLVFEDYELLTDEFRIKIVKTDQKHDWRYIFRVIIYKRNGPGEIVDMMEGYAPEVEKFIGRHYGTEIIVAY